MAGGCLPNPRGLDRGPEGAAGGHLDLQPTGPPSDRPGPSTSTVLAGSGPRPQAPPDVRPPATPPGPARHPPARPALPAADPTGPRGPLRLPPWPWPVRPPSPPPQLPRGPTQGTGCRESPGPFPLRLPLKWWRRAQRRYGWGCSARNPASAGPRAGRRGQRRRGPAPTLRARPSELRPRARPDTALAGVPGPVRSLAEL